MYIYITIYINIDIVSIGLATKVCLGFSIDLMENAK